MQTISVFGKPPKQKDQKELHLLMGRREKCDQSIRGASISMMGGNKTLGVLLVSIQAASSRSRTTLAPPALALCSQMLLVLSDFRMALLSAVASI